MRQHETEIFIPGTKLHQLKDNGNKNSFNIPNCKIYIKIYPKAKRTYQQDWTWLCPQNRETIYKKKKKNIQFEQYYSSKTMKCIVVLSHIVIWDMSTLYTSACIQLSSSTSL